MYDFSVAQVFSCVSHFVLGQWETSYREGRRQESRVASLYTVPVCYALPGNFCIWSLPKGSTFFFFCEWLLCLKIICVISDIRLFYIIVSFYSNQWTRFSLLDFVSSYDVIALRTYAAFLSNFKLPFHVPDLIRRQLDFLCFKLYFYFLECLVFYIAF